MASRAIGADAQWPPSWNQTGHGVAVGRYIDPAFARLEYDKLWTKVWQAAARLDEVPQPGDYTVYDIVDQSILVVRVDADTVKAYHNVCPHRGTALGVGCGTFQDRRIVCPFHGWRWNLAGQNQFVLERQEFRNGQLRDADVALKEVRVAVFAGFVFINMDANAMSFDEFIEPVRALLEDLATADMHHYWWKSIPIRANWKVAQEAFLETYHVPATHPQLDVAGAEFIRGDRAQVEFLHRDVRYDAYANGHGRFYPGPTSPSSGEMPATHDPVAAMAAFLQLLADGMDAQVLQDDVDVLKSLQHQSVPSGSNIGIEYVKALYANAAELQRPMPKPTPEALGMWGGEVFVFPNLMILLYSGNAMIYRARPVGFDPDQCTFEIMSTKTYPAAVKWPRAQLQHIVDVDDPSAVRLIPRQDLGNIPRIQKGLHSRSMRYAWFASHHEKIIANMHRELDSYVRAE